MWDVLNSRARGYGTGVPTTSEGGWWLLVFVFSDRQSLLLFLGDILSDLCQWAQGSLPLPWTKLGVPSLGLALLADCQGRQTRVIYCCVIFPRETQGASRQNIKYEWQIKVQFHRNPTWWAHLVYWAFLQHTGEAFLPGAWVIPKHLHHPKVSIHNGWRFQSLP